MYSNVYINTNSSHKLIKNEQHCRITNCNPKNTKHVKTYNKYKKQMENGYPTNDIEDDEILDLFNPIK